jgi:hypothetical protein
MAGEGSQARRVFLSHTSELRRYPASGSYVAAAESAIKRAGDVVVDMAYFAAEDRPPAKICEEQVRGSDVFVLIAGFRYGSPVRDRPKVSYTELEHEAATSANLPRLVFLLSEDIEGPAAMLVDAEYGARQEAFRKRLSNGDTTLATVTSPGGLEAALLHALIGPHRRPGGNREARGAIRGGEPEPSSGRTAFRAAVVAAAASTIALVAILLNVFGIFPFSANGPGTVPGPAAPSAEQSGFPARVIGQAPPGQPPDVHDSPSLDAPVVTTLKPESTVRIQCTVQGQRVTLADGSSTRLWDRIEQGYLPDSNLFTGQNEPAMPGCTG